MGCVEGRALSQTPDLACPSCSPPLPRAGRGIRVPQIAGWGLGRLQSPRVGGGEGQMPLPLLAAPPLPRLGNPFRCLEQAALGLSLLPAPEGLRKMNGKPRKG